MKVRKIWVARLTECNPEKLKDPKVIEVLISRLVIALEVADNGASVLGELPSDEPAFLAGGIVSDRVSFFVETYPDEKIAEVVVFSDGMLDSTTQSYVYQEIMQKFGGRRIVGI